MYNPYEQHQSNVLEFVQTVSQQAQRAIDRGDYLEALTILNDGLQQGRHYIQAEAGFTAVRAYVYEMVSSITGALYRLPQHVPRRPKLILLPNSYC